MLTVVMFPKFAWNITPFVEVDRSEKELDEYGDKLDLRYGGTHFVE